jgi:hypothetical protein
MARTAAFDAPSLLADLCFVRAGVVGRAFALSWAITPFVIPFDLFVPQNTIETALKFLVNQGRLRPGSTVVIIGLITAGEEIVDAVQMRII